jgi:hypothetical protein
MDFLPSGRAAALWHRPGQRVCVAAELFASALVQPWDGPVNWIAVSLRLSRLSSSHPKHRPRPNHQTGATDQISDFAGIVRVPSENVSSLSSLICSGVLFPSANERIVATASSYRCRHRYNGNHGGPAEGNRVTFKDVLRVGCPTKERFWSTSFAF